MFFYIMDKAIHIVLLYLSLGFLMFLVEIHKGLAYMTSFE